jgi:purine-nucleoside phosphorylase
MSEHVPSQGPRIAASVAQLRSKTSLQPKVALVLGSGLGAFADTLTGGVAVPYGEIAGMPVSAVEGHAGKLVIGEAEGLAVAAMQGRVHLYEGHDPCDVVFGLRLMLSLGAKTVILTNAAGGIKAGFAVGDLMLIEDHLNLTGKNCLVGTNEAHLGPRFVDLTEAYDRRLGVLAMESARWLGFELKRGVYAGLLGPTYETPAEIKMLRTLGADAVGMSTVLETIAARHMGARVLGISCITNLAAGMSGQPLNHEEVQETAVKVRDRFVGLIQTVLREIATGPDAP